MKNNRQSYNSWVKAYKPFLTYIYFHILPNYVQKERLDIQSSTLISNLSGNDGFIEVVSHKKEKLLHIKRTFEEFCKFSYENSSGFISQYL